MEAYIYPKRTRIQNVTAAGYTSFRREMVEKRTGYPASYPQFAQQEGSCVK